MSKNEILTGLNKPDEFILAIVKVDINDENTRGQEMFYVYKPFSNEPDFSATSVNFELNKLLKNAQRVI